MIDMNYEFIDDFDLENPRTMLMGLIAIDINPEHGAQCNLLKKKELKNVLRQSINLFPQGMKENDDLGDNGLLFSKSWLNGFSGLCKYDGILNVKDIDAKLSKWLNSKGITSSDQIFATRSASTMNTLFSCFRKYNGDRFVKKSTIDMSKFNNFTNSAGLLNDWKDEPLHCRYIVRSKFSKHKLDYLYLISGSEALMDHENLLSICESSVKEFLHMNNENKDFILNNYNCIFDGEVWSNNGTSGSDSSVLTKVRDTMKSAIRLFVGINYIYCYSIYAKQILGTDNFDVIEFNGDVKKTIDIDQIIEAYKEPYEYIRNLSILTNLAEIY